MGQAKIEDMEYQEEKTLTTKFLPLGCPKSYMGGKKQTNKHTTKKNVFPLQTFILKSGIITASAAFS